MIVQSALHNYQKTLESAGVETARLDCLLLLELVLHTDRTHLLAEPSRELTSEQINMLDRLIEQRCQHVPIAYLRGKAEFYGHNFIVSPQTLVPRPESEAIIELFAALSLPADYRLADIGCGSGCLGITAALERPGGQLWLTDMSSGALAIARQNADAYNVPAQFIQTDLLTNLDEQFDVLLCNLPYIPDSYPVNQAAQHEPAQALFGGQDGLDLYRRLFTQASATAKTPTYILTESLTDQHEALITLAKNFGYHAHSHEGLAHCFTSQA